MLSSALTEILIITGVIFAALIFIGIVIARLYTRSSKEVSFVRTGFGGEKAPQRKICSECKTGSTDAGTEEESRCRSKDKNH